jgi:nitrate reductase NapE component
LKLNMEVAPMWQKEIRTSEFWTGLVGAILAVFVQQGLVPKEYAEAINQFVAGLIAYALGRIISKTAKPGQVPLQAFLIAVALALASPARAASLLDPDRVNITLGADYEVHEGSRLRNEWAANAHLRAAATEHLALGVDGAYGFSNQLGRFTPDLRYRLSPGTGLAVGLGVDFWVGAESRLPEHATEWRAEAFGAIPLGKRLSVGVSASYGFESGEIRVGVGPRFWAKQAKAKP